MPTTSHRRWHDMVATGLVGTFLRLIAVVLAGSAAGPNADWNSPPSGDFPVVGGSYTNQRYSTLDQINSSNIQKLGGAWMFHVEENGAVGDLQGTPVVVGGVMYVTTPRQHVLAI